MPESQGLDCRICATFARQRFFFFFKTLTPGDGWSRKLDFWISALTTSSPECVGGGPTTSPECVGVTADQPLRECWWSASGGAPKVLVESAKAHLRAAQASSSHPRPFSTLQPHLNKPRIPLEPRNSPECGGGGGQGPPPRAFFFFFFITIKPRVE